MKSRRLLIAGLAFALMTAGNALFAQQQNTQASQESRVKGEAEAVYSSLNEAMKSPTTFQTRNPRYALRPGDVVELEFLQVPSYNQVLSIQPDGYISLRHVGDIYVAGKTVPELSTAVKQNYAKLMKDPVVTIVLKEFEHPYFIASGEIGKPGKYELRGPTTVAQAVAIAGGFSPVAKTTHVLLFRRVGNDSVDVKQLDVKRMLGNGKLQEDIELHPGDFVFVPKSLTAATLKTLLPHTSTGLYLPVRP